MLTVVFVENLPSCNLYLLLHTGRLAVCFINTWCLSFIMVYIVMEVSVYVGWEWQQVCLCYGDDVYVIVTFREA